MENSSSISQVRHPPLPPADDSIRQLEELFAKANVGFHEFATSGSDDNLDSHIPQPAIDEEVDESDEPVAMPTNDVTTDDALSSSGESEESGVLVEAHVSSQNESLVPEAEAKMIHDTPSGYNSQTMALYRPPKLNFFTDQKSVPVELNNLQQQSLRRRLQQQTVVHDLNAKVAELTAKLAHETMDRDKSLSHALAKGVYEPLQEAFENLSLKRDTQNPTQQWMTLERRLSSIDSQMTHSCYVQLQDAKRDHFRELGEELDLETTEEDPGDQRELSLARRWEAHAGTMARRFQEERAAGAAAIELTSNTLQSLRPQLGAEMLEELRRLRETLEHERAERIASDQRIREYIANHTDAMKQAILEAYPGM